LIEARKSELEDEELSEAAHHFLRAAPDHDGGRALFYAEKIASAAMSRLAHEEAVTHLDRALRLLELGAPDPAPRMRLLLAKGRALAHTLDSGAARSVLFEAFALAADLGALDVMVEVVALLCQPSETGTVDGARVDLLRQTLDLLPRDDQRRPMVTALLAKALCYSGELEERARLAREALAGARRLTPPALRGEALHCCHQALSEPDDLPNRIAIADELLLLAEQQGDTNLLLCASMAQITSSVETGDMGAVDTALATIETVVRRVREPFFKWYAACARSMRAMVDGDFDLAETQAEEALAIGKPLNAESAYHTYVTQVWGTWWLTGRTGEAEALVREMASRYPGIVGWRAIQASIDLDLGRKDPAQRALARLLSEVEKAARDSPFILSALCPLAELCARIGTPLDARALYEKLRPYARHHGFVHMGIATHGPMTRHLGLLAARMGETDLAIEHLSDSLVRAERMGSPTFSALCSLSLARVLLSKGSPDARERASVLLWNAAALSLRTGMTGLHTCCRVIVERFALELRSEPNGHGRIAVRARETC
jgi:tetratricopeptide (TPR) repeat protein